MKFTTLLALLILYSAASAQKEETRFYKADHAAFQYTGRIDYSDPLRPKFWAPGVYVEALFSGTSCEIILADELLWGNSHNYMEIVIDNRAERIKLKKAADTIRIEGLKNGRHRLLVCKDTEAGIGYVQFIGLRCNRLIPMKPKPRRRIEFIGNSITCGMGSDLSEVPCDKGVWYDQHNAWLSYGALTARKLDAQWHLSSVSGIGLIRSCCNMAITMPRVFDKMNMREDTVEWNFKNYQPDVVTVCLGQNDGIQDSVKFCSAYVRFLQQLRSHYPGASLVCLNSPMADEKLDPVLRKYITSVVRRMNQDGDRNTSSFFFSRRYHKGCGDHPNLEEHAKMSDELTGYIRRLKRWK